VIHSWWMRERLQALLDGELTETRQAALVDHVGRCARCASVLHDLAECDQLLVSCRPVPGGMSPAASQALFERVMTEARVGRRGAGRGMTLLAWGFTTLLAIAASSAASWWYRPAPPAHSGWIPAPRVDNRDEESGSARALEAVVGNGPFTGDVAADSRGKLPPKAPVRGAMQHPEKPAPHSPRVDGRSLEPRIRRPRHSRYQLIAEGDPPAYPTLLDQAHSGRGRSDTARVRATGESPMVSVEESLPVNAEGEWVDDPVAEQQCDYEAVRLVSAALDGDTGALQRVVEALVDDASVRPDPSGGLVESTEQAPGPELALNEWPLPWEGEDPESRPWEGGLSSPQLLVMVSCDPAPPAVVVTDAPEEMPGYARATTCRPDASGHDTWLQATALTDQKRTRTDLVMLGDEVWDW
jgi:hypothetical protein